jgi:hypothetical protein
MMLVAVLLVVALATASLTALSLAVAADVVLWLAATVRHAHFSAGRAAPA